MPRFVIIALVGLAFLLSAGAMTDGSPAQAAGHSAGAPKASVDDFYFQSLDADYHLGRNEAGNSTLHTVETIVAVFPDHDQNRGIRRAIPNTYDGHPVDLQILLVTDETGTALSHDINKGEDDDFTVVTVAAKDYVHGAKTYVIEYLQTNVTLEPDDATAATANEFYWDVNGTGWAQPFNQVTARVHLDAALAAAFTGSAACYQGFSGLSYPCGGLSQAEAGGGLLVTARADRLGPQQNLTIALGFADGTFVPRDNSYLASPASFGQLAALVVLLGATLFAVVKRRTAWRDAPGRGIIIPEYLPPKQVTPLLASTVYGKSRKATAAELLNLAVNRNVRVIEESPGSGRGKSSFHFEYVSDAGLTDHGAELVTALFGAERFPGDRKNMSKPDSRLSSAMQKLVTKTKELVLSLGYRRKPSGRAPLWSFLVGGVAAVLSILFGVVSIDDDRGVLLAVLLIVATIGLSFLLIGLVADVRPLTAVGAELRDYLKGLEMYIRLAEAHRMRMLQSPGGAVRTPFRPIGQTPWSAPAAVSSGATDSSGATISSGATVETGQIVKLYERLLPYAVLFGLEKEWSAQLGSAYEQTGTRPDWYQGSGAFNTGMFVAGVGAFSSTASSSWSGSSSSSSGGGSGGGGFSGGGGGGGGGGGV